MTVAELIKELAKYKMDEPVSLNVSFEKEYEGENGESILYCGFSYADGESLKVVPLFSAQGDIVSIALEGDATNGTPIIGKSWQGEPPIQIKLSEL